MAAAIADAKAAGVTRIVFGDLFLPDVRQYREDKLAGTGIAPLFPLWERPTAALAREMIAAGVETYLTCVDLKQLPKAFAGRRFDEKLLARIAGRRRSLRRERRISFLRRGRSDAVAADSGHGRRDDRARRLRVCGYSARSEISSRRQPTDSALYLRSFPRKREPRADTCGICWPWVPACAGTNGESCDSDRSERARNEPSCPRLSRASTSCSSAVLRRGCPARPGMTMNRYPRNTPPVRLPTSATILAPMASIS